tara:strand:+ start:5525 stop:6136 length:612 start_codon:yes stop_codon:yes gene_type:complete
MKNLLFILFSFLALSGSAQHFTMRRAELVEEANSHIRNIKNGVVLVRLHTQENKIKHFLKYDNYEAAQAVRREQVEKNKAIFTAFKEVFDFTKLYFFYSHHSAQVKEGDFSTGFLLNDAMEEDPRVFLPEGVPVYIIDVGDVYFDNFGTHMKGMVVMNQQFEPLENPFPYYIRKRSGLKILERSDVDMVAKLNENLHEFYQSY